MTLAAGSRLGAYEIVSQLGAGGMGEVYLARDTTLDRQAAIKVLPASVASEADRLARFEREAKALAALNHPNIAQVYGVERRSRDEAPAIAMEFVPGEDLSEILARGAIAPDDALTIARQIAAALEAAHGAGIVHRDLKPANVKVRPDGTVKVLDFGLAKAGDPTSTSSVDAMNSPTLTARATELGVILGTAAYMAPEQAKGRATDRRVDVWAFGVVLYEMLTGRRAFGGDDVTEVLAAVIRDTPPLDALPVGTPSGVRRLLARCLQKDPARRLRDMGDVGLELDEAVAGGSDEVRDAAQEPAPRRLSMAAMTVSALLLAGLAGSLAWWLKPSPAGDHPVVRFEQVLPENAFLMTLSSPSVAVSRDGRRFAWVEQDRLMVRDLDLPGARVVASTLPGGSAGIAISPDREWIALASTICACLDKWPVAGGPSQPLARDVEVDGVYWTDDGRILFGSDEGVMVLPESGGQPEVFADPGDANVAAAFPQLLPGGRFVLYSRLRGLEADVLVQPVGGGEPEVVLAGVLGARYVTSGHLVYGEAQRLMAIAFDLGARRPVGSPVALPDTVAVSSRTDFAQLAVSETGVLVTYAPSASGENQLELAWTDETGATSPALDVPRRYSDPRLSPDGRRVALHVWDEANDIWVADLERHNLTRLTFDDREDETPAWSPDGLFIAYSSDRDAGRVVARTRADGSAGESEEVLWQGPEHVHVNDWSPDGSALLIEYSRSATRNDVFSLDVASGDVTPLLASRFSESQARISPDGRWLAYTSDESGRNEVYVQPYPSLAARVMASTGGAMEPVWSPDSRQLYFRAEDDVMAAAVTGSDPLEMSTPRTLFPDRFIRTQGATHTHFDQDAQGRFLFIIPSRDVSADALVERRRFVIVANWFDELKRLVPGR